MRLKFLPGLLALFPFIASAQIETPGSGSGGVTGAEVTNIVVALAGTNAPTSSSTNALGVASTNLLWANTIFVDAVNGNNATAIRGDASKPYLSASNAIAAVQSGDTVLFRPGDYTVPTLPNVWTTNAPLKIYSKTNVIIAGMNGARLRSSGHGLGSMFAVGFVTNLIFRDLELTGVLTNDVSGGQSGAVWIEGTSKHIKFERMNVNNWHNQGIVTYRHPDTGFDYQWMSVKDSQFRNIGFTNFQVALPNDGTAIVLCGEDMEVSGNGFGPDVLRDFETFNQDTFPQIWRRYIISNNRSFGSKECSICQGATNVQDWVIFGNTFKQFGTNKVAGANQTAIGFYGGQGVSIYGNTFEGGDSPIEFKSDALGYIDRITIQNNLFKNVFGSAILMYRATAQGPSPKRINILDNIFLTVTNYGIYGHFTDGQISRNTFIDVGIDGTSPAVYFGANGGAILCTNTFIHDNVIEKSGDISYTAASIEIGARSDKAHLFFNTIGPGVGAIVNNGTQTRGLLGRNIFDMAGGAANGLSWLATNSTGEGAWGVVELFDKITITNDLTVSNIFVRVLRVTNYITVSNIFTSFLTATNIISASNGNFHNIYVTNNASFSNAQWRAAERLWTIYGLPSSDSLWLTNNGFGLWWELNTDGVPMTIHHKVWTNVSPAQFASSLWTAGAVSNLSTLTNAGAARFGSSVWVAGAQTNLDTIRAEDIIPLTDNTYKLGETNLAWISASMRSLKLVDPNGVNYVSLNAPSALIGTSYELQFPKNQGSADQVLVNSGAGVLQWSNYSASAASGTNAFASLSIAGPTAWTTNFAGGTIGCVSNMTLGYTNGFVSWGTTGAVQNVTAGWYSLEYDMSFSEAAGSATVSGDILTNGVSARVYSARDVTSTSYGNYGAASLVWLPANTIIQLVNFYRAGSGGGTLSNAHFMVTSMTGSVGPTGATGPAGGGVTTNANQFGASAELTIKDGVLLTNIAGFGTISNNGPVQLSSSLWMAGYLTNRGGIRLDNNANMKVEAGGGDFSDGDFLGDMLLFSVGSNIRESTIDYRAVVQTNHNTAAGTNFITHVADIGTPDGADRIPIVDVSAATRKYVLASAILGGSGGPTTNAPPQTLAINSALGSTNILIDMLALVATNHVRATLTANAGVMFTNVVDGKAITLELIQDATGNRTVSTNATWGFNVRFGIDVTGFGLSTNASTKDIFRFIGSGTNALVAGNLRGFAL